MRRWDGRQTEWVKAFWYSRVHICCLIILYFKICVEWLEERERRGEEGSGDLVYYISSTRGEHCVPGPLLVQLDKSKEWTGGVGMVLEWYNEMITNRHVASPALRMEREESACPQWPQPLVTGTATSCQSGSEWVGLWVRARLEHVMTSFMAGDSLSV